MVLIKTTKYHIHIKLIMRNDIGILNYHLSSFIPKKQMTRVKFLDSSSKSKLYDNLVYILPSDGTSI